MGCLDHEFSSFIDQLTQTKWTGGEFSWRPWIWQTCTEFGWYQTTNQKDQLFGNLLELGYFQDWCRLAFEELEWPDQMFVHGSVDPWHPMGVLENLSLEALGIYIMGTSHC